MKKKILIKRRIMKRRITNINMMKRITIFLKALCTLYMLEFPFLVLELTNNLVFKNTYSMMDYMEKGKFIIPGAGLMALILRAAVLAALWIFPNRVQISKWDIEGKGF
jgi:hypothetical protein